MKTMKLVIKNWLLLGLLLSCNVLLGQSLKSDLERMYQQYEGKEDLYVEMNNRVFENGVEQHQSTTKIYKKGSLYHYKMGHQAILINKDYLVVVDHKMKHLSYDVWTAYQAKKMASMSTPMPKDILAKYPVVEFKGERNGLRHYSLVNEKLQMSHVDVFFDVKTGFIKKMIQRYNPKIVKGDVYMEMRFEAINTNPSFQANTFSEQQYLTIEGTKAVAAKAYKKYALRASKNLR